MRTEANRFIRLGRGPRQPGDMASQSARELDRHVPQATKTQNADVVAFLGLLPLTDAQAQLIEQKRLEKCGTHQRGPDRLAATQKGCSAR